MKFTVGAVSAITVSFTCIVISICAAVYNVYQVIQLNEERQKVQQTRESLVEIAKVPCSPEPMSAVDMMIAICEPRFLAESSCDFIYKEFKRRGLVEDKRWQTRLNSGSDF